MDRASTEAAKRGYTGPLDLPLSAISKPGTLLKPAVRRFIACLHRAAHQVSRGQGDAGTGGHRPGASSLTRLIASDAAAVRVSTPSLAWTCSRCFFTVAGLEPRMSPMSRLVLPLHTQ